jgi:cytochrome c
LSPGSEDPVQRLVNAGGCAGCHALDRRVVGPSFKEIAARYADDADAERKLAGKIRNGGQGAWGSVPMPPNPGLGDAELITIVTWVLQQK